MKCPKCDKQNKPGVEKCAYCDEKMPVRKKAVKTSSASKTSTNTKTVNSKTDTKSKPKTVSKSKTSNSAKKDSSTVVKKTAKKTQTKKVPKVVEEPKKEPILELSDEKRELKNLLTKVKKAKNIILLYVFIILLSLSLIFFINKKLSVRTCTLNNITDNASYKVKISIKHHGEVMNSFKYKTVFTSKEKKNDDFKQTYDTILDNLKSKKGFNSIVSSNYTNKKWNIIYSFEDSEFDLTDEYVGLDLEPYKSDISIFVRELESVGFDCN